MLQRAKVGRTASDVDARAVVLAVDLRNGRAEFAQRVRSDRACGAVGGVDDDVHAVQLSAALVQFFVVVLAEVLPDTRDADLGSDRARQVRIVEQRFDFALDLVGQLESVWSEEFDSVIGDRIVRCADHDAGGSALTARDAGDRGRRHDAEGNDVAPDGGNPGDDCRLEHRSGETRVATDDDRRSKVVCGVPREDRRAGTA